MFNWWLIYLNEITAKPTPEQRLKFYGLWTGHVPIQNPEYERQWSLIYDSLERIYENFNQNYHPEVSLQTLLQKFLTSEDGFLNFYLTFVGQYRGNNFFPTPSGFNEFKQQKACREEGCFFQIPIIMNYHSDNVFDVGPALNIMPDNESNTYLKNYWRAVFILSHKIAKNISPIITLIAKPREYQRLFVKNVVPRIISGIETILDIVNLKSNWVTIPEQYYNGEIPFFNGSDPRSFYEISFNYWIGKHNIYQSRLKVNLAWTVE